MTLNGQGLGVLDASSVPMGVTRGSLSLRL